MHFEILSEGGTWNQLPDDRCEQCFCCSDTMNNGQTTEDQECEDSCCESAANFKTDFNRQQLVTSRTAVALNPPVSVNSHFVPFPTELQFFSLPAR